MRQENKQTKNAPEFEFKIEHGKQFTEDYIRLEVESGINGTTFKEAYVEIDSPDTWDETFTEGLENSLMAYLITVEPSKEDARKFAQHLLNFGIAKYS